MKVLITASLFFCMILCCARPVSAREQEVPVVEDTYVQEGFPDTPPSDNRNLFVGFDTHYNKGRTRILVRPDWSAVNTSAPGALVGVHLFLFQYQVHSTSSYRIQLSAFAGIDLSRVTWRTQPTTNRYTTVSIPAREGWIDIDLTDWYTSINTQPEVLMLRAENEEKAGGTFWSSACAVAPFEPRCQREQPYLVVTIDDTPPPIPTLDKEPPITNGSSNTLEWSKVKDDFSDSVEYQVQSSQVQDFAVHSLSSWVSSPYIIVGDLPDGVTYFRLRARDQFGNVSDWSSPTWSYHDLQPPQITHFSRSPAVISPNHASSRGVHDYTVITTGATDPAWGEASVEVYNQDHQIVYEKSLTKAHEQTHWPTSTQAKMPEGRYFIYYTARDDFGHAHRRGPLVVTIDNTPPSPALVLTPLPDSLTNRQRPVIRYSLEAALVSRVALDGRTVFSTRRKTVSTTLPSLSEGKHSILVLVVDEAGNTSETKITITVDTHAPAPPQLELITESKTFVLKVRGESSAHSIITQNGRRLTSGQLTRGVLSFPVTLASTSEGVFVWTVRLRDAAGNVSKASTITHRQQFGTGSSAPAAKEFPEQMPSIECSINITDQPSFSESCHNQQLALRKVDALAQRASWHLEGYAGVPRLANFTINRKQCAPPRWYDPRTWWCGVSQAQQYQVLQQEGISQLSFAIDNTSSPAELPVTALSSFEGTQALVQGETSQNYGKRPFHIRGFVRWYWFDPLTKDFMVLTQAYEPSNQVLSEDFPVFQEVVRRYFSWLFPQPVGVTQWHGFTAYQSPHAGIDFGVSDAPVLAPADGTIVSAGYDRYGGNCNQGGNYLGIEHPNGLFTYYFHLKNYTDDTGRTLRQGQKVKRGQHIATTGNSGKYNCQPLLPHLHFEVRTCRNARCHVDPVPYFDIDWKTVPTLNKQQFPGRLKGDNPHPGM